MCFFCPPAFVLPCPGTRTHAHKLIPPPPHHGIWALSSPPNFPSVAAGPPKQGTPFRFRLSTSCLCLSHSPPFVPVRGAYTALGATGSGRVLGTLSAHLSKGAWARIADTGASSSKHTFCQRRMKWCLLPLLYCSESARQRVANVDVKAPHTRGMDIDGKGEAGRRFRAFVCPFQLPGYEA